MMIQVEGYKDLRVEENVVLTVGRRCHFNGMIIHNDGALKISEKPKVTIGDGVRVGRGCLVRTSDHDFRRGYPIIPGTAAGYAVGDVTIGNYVWLGGDILIMKGITIGDYAIIQARSVVVSNIPPYAIAGGHPCRTFAYRDREEVEFFKSVDLTQFSTLEEQNAHFDQQFAEFKARKAKSIEAPQV